MENKLIKNGFIKQINSNLFSKKSTSNENLQMDVILIDNYVCVQFVSIENRKSPIDKWSTGFTIEEINEIYDKFNDLVG